MNNTTAPGGWPGPAPDANPYASYASPQFQPQATHPQATYPQANPSGSFSTSGLATWRRKLTTEQLTSIVLAAAGVGVTLIGVVLLLLIAAREGILTPPIRVGGGLVASALLAAAAFHIRPKLGGRVGSVGLLAVAFGALFFDVIAVTRIYEWVPVPAGLGLGLLVAGLGAVVAVRWNEQWLLAAINIAAAVLGPVLASGFPAELTAFLIVLQVAGIAPELLKGWKLIGVTRTLPVIIGANLQAMPSRTAWVLGLIILLVGLASGVAAARRSWGHVSSWWLPIVFLPVVPLFADLHSMTLCLAAFGMAALAALAALALMNGGDGWITSAVTSAIWVCVALSVPHFGDWLPVPVLIVALVASVLAFASSIRWAGALAGALVLVGWGMTAYVATPEELFYRAIALDHLGAPQATAGALLVACALLLLARVRTLVDDILEPAAMLLVLFVLLYGATTGTVSMLATSSDSFFVAHLLVTIEWVAMAIALLLAGLADRVRLSTSMIGGLIVVGISLVKLLTFDLAYMGAVTRALTFLVAGLMLLAAGTKYARTYAEIKNRRSANPGSSGHQAPAA